MMAAAPDPDKQDLSVNGVSFAISDNLDKYVLRSISTINRRNIF